MAAIEIHYCGWASQPDLQFACGISSTPSWSQSKDLPEGVYDSDGDGPYTFEHLNLVTCPRCLKNISNDLRSDWEARQERYARVRTDVHAYYSHFFPDTILDSSRPLVTYCCRIITRAPLFDVDRLDQIYESEENGRFTSKTDSVSCERCLRNL